MQSVPALVEGVQEAPFRLRNGTSVGDKYLIGLSHLSLPLVHLICHLFEQHSIEMAWNGSTVRGSSYTMRSGELSEQLSSPSIGVTPQ
jgi:hypothetical protein